MIDYSIMQERNAFFNCKELRLCRLLEKRIFHLRMSKQFIRQFSTKWVTNRDENLFWCFVGGIFQVGFLLYFPKFKKKISSLNELSI